MYYATFSRVFGADCEVKTLLTTTERVKLIDRKRANERVLHQYERIYRMKNSMKNKMQKGSDFTIKMVINLVIDGACVAYDTHAQILLISSHRSCTDTCPQVTYSVTTSVDCCCHANRPLWSSRRSSSTHRIVCNDGCPNLWCEFYRRRSGSLCRPCDMYSTWWHVDWNVWPSCTDTMAPNCVRQCIHLCRGHRDRISAPMENEKKRLSC